MPPNSAPEMMLGVSPCLAEFMAIDGSHFRTQSRGKFSAKFFKDHESEIVYYIVVCIVVTKEG